MRISDWSSDVVSSDLRATAQRETDDRKFVFSFHGGRKITGSACCFPNDARHQAGLPANRSACRRGSSASWKFDSPTPTRRYNDGALSGYHTTITSPQQSSHLDPNQPNSTDTRQEG